jgi:hypothetical protein
MPTATCARCGRPVEPGEHLCAQCREEVGPAAAAAPPAVGVAQPRRDPDEATDPSDLDRRRDRWPSTMVRPSPVQYHATIFVTVVLVLTGLAVWAFLGHRGVGPFRSDVRQTGQFRAGTQTIVVAVANKGSRTSRATCSFKALDASGTELATTTLLTAPIPGHTTVEVTQVFRGLATKPAAYDSVCS